ncbi:MAG: thiamine-phosphate kinase, partial [Dongiaceae bacterium]
PGDLLAVTGTLGRAAAGLLALGSGGGLSGGAGLGRGGDLGSGRGDVGAGTASQQDSLLARAIDAQRRPQPRLAEGRALSATGAVRAMIDLSDGLALDLARLCQASAVGVRLDADRLPVDPSVHAIAGAAAAEGKTALDVALYGGEDYELLFAVAPDDVEHVLARLAEATGTPATIIGAFEPASAGRTMTVDGSRRPLEPGGWTHFRRTEAT